MPAHDFREAPGRHGHLEGGLRGLGSHHELPEKWRNLGKLVDEVAPASVAHRELRLAAFERSNQHVEVNLRG
jgi:hypothetical protein